MKVISIIQFTNCIYRALFQWASKSHLRNQFPRTKDTKLMNLGAFESWVNVCPRLRLQNKS